MRSNAPSHNYGCRSYLPHRLLAQTRCWPPLCEEQTFSTCTHSLCSLSLSLPATLQQLWLVVRTMAHAAGVRAPQAPPVSASVLASPASTRTMIARTEPPPYCACTWSVEVSARACSLPIPIPTPFLTLVITAIFIIITIPSPSCVCRAGCRAGARPPVKVRPSRFLLDRVYGYLAFALKMRQHVPGTWSCASGSSSQR